MFNLGGTADFILKFVPSVAFGNAWDFVFAFSACAGTDKKPVIGIIQFGSHGSLNNCYDGIMEGLKANGIDPEQYTIEHVDSNFDASVSQSQAKTFVNKKAAVIIAIATPSAVAAATAADGDIPWFTAPSPTARSWRIMKISPDRRIFRILKSSSRW